MLLPYQISPAAVDRKWGSDIWAMAENKKQPN